MHILAAALALILCPARADDLQYNLPQQMQTEFLNEATLGARVCMYDTAKMQLFSGVRDTAKIIESMLNPCSLGLFEYLTQTLHVPPDKARAWLRAMAYDELSHVPGLTHSAPASR